MTTRIPCAYIISWNGLLLGLGLTLDAAKTDAEHAYTDTTDEDDEYIGPVSYDDTDLHTAFWATDEDGEEILVDSQGVALRFGNYTNNQLCTLVLADLADVMAEPA